MFKKMTVIQKITMVMIALYLIWEIAVQVWALKQPPQGAEIRADLIFIYPVLIILILISVIQFIARNKKNL